VITGNRNVNFGITQFTFDKKVKVTVTTILTDEDGVVPGAQPITSSSIRSINMGAFQSEASCESSRAALENQI
jgi:hypothetical protein